MLYNYYCYKKTTPRIYFVKLLSSFSNIKLSCLQFFTQSARWQGLLYSKPWFISKKVLFFLDNKSDNDTSE